MERRTPAFFRPCWCLSAATPALRDLQCVFVTASPPAPLPPERGAAHLRCAWGMCLTPAVVGRPCRWFTLRRTHVRRFGISSLRGFSFYQPVAEAGSRPRGRILRPRRRFFISPTGNYHGLHRRSDRRIMRQASGADAKGLNLSAKDSHPPLWYAPLCEICNLVLRIGAFAMRFRNRLTPTLPPERGVAHLRCAWGMWLTPAVVKKTLPVVFIPSRRLGAVREGESCAPALRDL